MGATIVEVPIGYSADRQDLYSPGNPGATFFDPKYFPPGLPPPAAGLCAEMARLAYCRTAGTLYFDQPRINASVRSIGFSGCVFFETPHAHAFLALRTNYLSVLAFRGTDADDPMDLGYDADFILKDWKFGKVHTGFADAFDALMEVPAGLKQKLQALEGNALYTGHSLGAAIATLCAPVIRPQSLYTFGSPMVGNADFVKGLGDIPNYRYVDCCDIVTCVPPTPGYVHAGLPRYIDSDRRISDNPSNDLVAADQSAARMEYLKQFARRRAMVGLRDMADHAPINYCMPILAAGETH